MVEVVAEEAPDRGRRPG